MQLKLKIQTVICTVLFFAVSMSVMIVYAHNKVITVADIAQDKMSYGKDGLGAENSSGGAASGGELKLAGTHTGEYLRIPLEASIKAENITMENHYMDKELWISIQGMEASFYEEQVIDGNLSNILSGTYEYQDGLFLLKLKTKDVYECRNILKDKNLYIAFDRPGEIFDKIVVIDPGEGGEEHGYEAHGIIEKEINLDIAKRVKEKLDATDIKVYYTRMDDTNPSWEERVELANSVKADMLISIHTNADAEETSLYGTETIYSSQFFIPRFGSVELADILEREVVTSISGRGNGLVEAVPEDAVIWNATVPAALIMTGYITNKQEAALLARENYREQIAEGIYNAVVKAYEQNGQAEGKDL